MNRLFKYLSMAAICFALLQSTDAMAQQRQRGQRNQGGQQQGQQDNQQGGRQRQGGNFDPAQMQQRILDNYKEQLAVTDESEWKIISAAITKVLDARREAGSSRGGFGGGMTRRPQGGNQDANADQNQNRTRGGSSVLPEAEELQKAIAGNASKDEIKSKMAAYRTARQTKQAALDAAMDDLKKLLSSKQEAIALLNGLVR